jgi:hypothetical protein
MKTGLVIDSESMCIGLMLGVGLPVTGTFSNVNIDLNLVKKTTAGLVQQNYANISIGFLLTIDGLKESSTKIKCLFLASTL